MYGKRRNVEESNAIPQNALFPGTEIMIDDGQFHVLSNKQDGFVLVPQPSQDPNDPLNWSILWKVLAISIASLFSFAQGLGPLAIAPIFPELAKEFHSDLAGVVHFTGVTILVLGFSNFLWIPLSEIFGRRFVILASSALCVGAFVWKAKASSYSSFMGAAVLNGIAAAPGEALQPTIITDTIFLHQRGINTTIYFVSFYSSLILGPIIAGSMAKNVGWRSFWWLNVALNLTVFLLALVCFPETKWKQRRTKTDQLDSRETASEHDTKEGVTVHEGPKPGDSSPERNGKAIMENESLSDDFPVGRGRPGSRQWWPLQPSANPLKPLALQFLLPWKLFFNPIVQFASFVVSFSSSCFLTITFVQAEAFTRKVYHFDSQAIGFTNFAALVGVLIGLFSAGPASDWVSAALTKRNNGIREPEMRLLTMIPYVVIMIVANFILGFGFEYLWSWEVLVIIGIGLAGIQVTALPSIAATYAIDCYKPASGAIFILITINKNVWGYGVSQFIIPWVENDGFLPPFMTIMCLTFLWCCFGVVFWFGGKRVRGWTANSSIHRM